MDTLIEQTPPPHWHPFYNYMPRLHFANCANPRVLVTGISLAGGQIPPDYFSVGRRLFIEWSGFREPFHSNGINYIARRRQRKTFIQASKKDAAACLLCAKVNWREKRERYFKLLCEPNEWSRHKGAFQFCWGKF